jgi:CIC family chloride channel protein
MNFQNILDKVAAFRSRYISNRTFLILVSIVVGIVAGLAAISLKILVHTIQHLLHRILENPSFNFLLFIFPLIGILFTVFYVQRFRNGKIGHGIGSILLSIAKRSSNIERDKTYSHMISSALTIGFGGSAGLEAPIVVTGAALGSNTAKDLKMNYHERTLMLACGVAAGISAIFNSPIAGVLFAVEVILSEFTIPAFIPILISSATASVLSIFLYKEKLFFLITSGWNMNAIPFYAILGILLGLTSVYVTRTAIKTENYFKSKTKPYQKAILGGTILGLMIFILPPLYGEGYYTIENLLTGNYQRLLDNSLFNGLVDNGWFIVLIGAIIVLVKIIATSITIGSGGNGGIFAPSLFIGALTGFVFAHAVNLLGIIHLAEANFIVAAMAGALSGVIHAPLTGIFLIAEITGGYVLFVPLMIVSSLSFLIARYFEPYSIYARALVENGFHAKDRDKIVLNRIELKDILETDFVTIKMSDTLGQLIVKFEKSKRNMFPVLDEENSLLGVVLLDNIREIMFHPEQYDAVFVANLMTQPQCILNIDEELHDVMKKFDKFGTWNLPVVDANIYKGFVSKSTILTKYRHLVIKQTEQQFT